MFLHAFTSRCTVTLQVLHLLIRLTKYNFLKWGHDKITLFFKKTTKIQYFFKNATKIHFFLYNDKNTLFLRKTTKIHLKNSKYVLNISGQLSLLYTLNYNSNNTLTKSGFISTGLHCIKLTFKTIFCISISNNYIKQLNNKYLFGVGVGYTFVTKMILKRLFFQLKNVK